MSHPSCCTDTTAPMIDDIDTPLDLATLEWIGPILVREKIGLVVHLPMDHGWASWPVRATELRCLCDGAHSAWIVQRPGCGGLVSRIVLLDGDLQPVASIAAARGNGEPEPPAWRTVLLMALLASQHGAPSPTDEALPSPIRAGGLVS